MRSEQSLYRIEVGTAVEESRWAVRQAHFGGGGPVPDGPSGGGSGRRFRLEPLGALAEPGFGNRVAYGRRLPLIGSTGAALFVAPATTL